MALSPEQSSSLKKVAISAAVVLLVAVGGFSAGRFSAPLKVETKEVEKVVYKDKIVEKVVEKVVMVEVKAKAETKIVYVDRVITKEGEVRERIVERTGTTENTNTNTNVAVTDDTNRTSEGSKTVEVIKTVTLQPNWRVGILVGASLKDPFIPIAGPLVLGAQVEHRIFGGLSGGLWINTVGAAGAVVSMEF